MSSRVNVTVHASQFPQAVRRELIQSLRSRRVNHKFHYDSVKQTQKWLELHQAYSPSRTDPDCARIYDQGFEAAVRRIGANRALLVGLGCGGGQKDARLLKLIRDARKEPFYAPVDVSMAMVLVAREAAREIVGDSNCFPLVCDLASAEDWQALFDESPVPQAARLITFFGMLPNFEPEPVFGNLARLLAPGDSLLLSANLAPGPDYEAGVEKVLPLYDNALTREWLMLFLLDLGVERADGTLQFSIEEMPLKSGPKRIAARFQFARARELQVDNETINFAAGESINLFFSCRYTPALVQASLARHGLRAVEQWITRSEEEGVFLVVLR